MTIQSNQINDDARKQVPACLFNIIVYVESLESKKKFQNYLDLLKKKFPCRSILIYEQPDKKNASVDFFLNGEKVDSLNVKKARDQVGIYFGKEAQDSIPFLILSNLLGDLPIYVIWVQDLTKNNLILDHIQKIATKIIFDPTLTENISEYAASVLKFIDVEKCGVSDFAWFSIKAWKELLSTLFNTPQKIDHLFHAEMIRISYYTSKDKNERHEIPATYLQGWMAAALNWKIGDIETIEGNIRIGYERFIHDTIVLLTPQVTENENFYGKIAAIEIETSTKMHFLLKRTDVDKIFKLWISTEESCEIPTQITLAEPGQQQLVFNELFWRKTSDHYKNMLRLFYQI